MLKKPQLYATSQSSMKFNGEVFWKMFFNAIVHSCLLFFITVACFSDDLLNHGAESNGLAMEAVNSFSGQVGGYLFIGTFFFLWKLVDNLSFKNRLRDRFLSSKCRQVTGQGFLRPEKQNRVKRE